VKIITKDILTVERGVIAHQCNNRGVMGAGLAKAIKKKWPEAFEAYREMCRVCGAELGSVSYYHASPTLIIANIIAQNGYGRNKQIVYTDYGALRQGLYEVYETANKYNLPLYLPYKIGCGLGGGNWDIVSRIIEDVAPEAIICKKEDRISINVTTN